MTDGPGWYIDPERAGYARWFDGTAWTEDRVLMSDYPTTPPAPPAPGPEMEAFTDTLSRQRHRLIRLGAVAVVVVVAVVVASQNGDDGGGRRAATIEPVYVIYEVEGSTDYADITYETPSGTAQQSPDVPMVMAAGSDRAGQRGLRVGAFLPGEFVYISAQNNRSHGTITCRISTEAGVVLAENTSSGGYAVASCSAHAR